MAIRKCSLLDATGIDQGIDDRAICWLCPSRKKASGSEPRQRDNAWNAVLTCDYYISFVPPLAQPHAYKSAGVTFTPNL